MRIAFLAVGAIKQSERLRYRWTSLCFGGCLLLTASHAQNVTTNIAPTVGDGDFGSTVTQAGSVFEITGGARPNSGTNLFHSFEQFNVGMSDTASFTNDAGLPTENILSQVTGGTRSDIFGIIQTTGFPDANLFLINRAGILFGPGSSLNVEGSFHASTADFIELSDGTRFSSTSSSIDTLLTTAPPEAFGFLGEDEASIEVDGGSLTVQPSQNISLVGGDLHVNNSKFVASAGTIHMVSVAGQGEAQVQDGVVDLEPEQSRGAIAISQSDIGDFFSPNDGSYINIAGGEVEISGSFLNANSVNAPGRGIDIDAEGLALNGAFLFSQTHGSEKGGNININARNGVSMLSGLLDTKTLGLGSAGDISIITEELTLDGAAFVDASSSDVSGAGNINVEASGDVLLTNSSALFAEGPQTGGGDISVTAENLTINERGSITTASFAGGSAGQIDFVVDETVTLTGGGTLVTSRADGSSDAGDIRIQTKNLNITDGARIAGETRGAGRGADVDIISTESVFISGGGSLAGETSAVTTETIGEGNAGNVAVTTSSLTVTEGAEIVASTSGDGNGGSVNITATNLDLDHVGTVSTSTSGLGSAGSISAIADNATLTDGARIESTTNTIGAAGTIEANAQTLVVSGQSSAITSETRGEGDAGSIRIQAGRFVVQNGGEVSVRTETSGQGGGLTVHADTLELTEGRLTASTSGQGKGGEIDIQATNVQLDGGASISAESTGTGLDLEIGEGQSGNIKITATDSLRIFDESSVSVKTDEADAGNIDLKAGFLLHLRNGDITTSAAVDEMGEGTGNGGDITIDPVFVVLERGSTIAANAREDEAGDINITTTGALFRSFDSDITASNARNLNGNIQINSPDTDVIAGALDLPESLLNISALLNDRCTARTQKSSSSLIVSGRGGVPPGPGAAFTGPGPDNCAVDQYE